MFCNEDGMYMSGLKSVGMLHFNGKRINMSSTLSQGTHNVRPYRNGILFNDTKSDVVRYLSRNQDEDPSFKVPMPDKSTLTGLGVDQSKVARAGFGRGLM